MKSVMTKLSSPARFLFEAGLLALTGCLVAVPHVAAQTESILYSFGAAPDAVNPQSKLVADAGQNFYGSSYSGGADGAGAVYKLSPPALPGGAWTESVIYSFNNVTGDFPLGNLAIDNRGNIFGTTTYAGDPTCYCGTVYKLKPPAVAGGTWSFENLHSFTNTAGDGASPQVGVVLDSKGAVYGTTDGGGATGLGIAYKIASVGSGFVETILTPLQGAGFHGPLIFDSVGNLYGVTGNGGTYHNGSVFKLSAPTSGTGSWTETTLFSFRAETPGGYFPQGSLVMDSRGQLYGTNAFNAKSADGAQTGGTVFRLTPPAVVGEAWTRSTLYTFTGSGDGTIPTSGMILNTKTGVFYGTTSNSIPANGCGVVFSLTPPAVAGGAWSEAVLHTFAPIAGDGCYPNSSPALDASGNLVGVAGIGGISNSGVAYQVVR